MSEVLSNDQIAALVEAARGGQIPAELQLPTGKKPVVKGGKPAAKRG